MAALRFTASAENDLVDMWSFLAEENPSAADRMLDVIYREANLLLAQPRMGRSRPELVKGIRCWPTSTPYLIFYYPRDDGIVVARVLHHARDVFSVHHWPKR